MSSDFANLNDWPSVLDYKTRILYAQISRVAREVAEYGGDNQLLEELTEPYFELLKSVYTEDYPLASAIQQSDLLLRLEGPAISKENPRISVIAGELTKVRTQVGKVARALVEITRSFVGSVEEVDLGLSAFAKGSLILGFTVPTETIETKGAQESLFVGADDPYLQAAREAIRTIGIVTKHVTENGSPEQLSKLIDDPKVRDTALSAVKELSPSGRSGITTVRVSGRSIDGLEITRPLTKTIRETIRKRIERPIAGSSTDPPVTIIGQVREMDLDNKRFEIKNLEGFEDSTIKPIRCSYLNESDEEAKEWLNSRVRVSGKAERDQAGNIRLLETTSIEVLN